MQHIFLNDLLCLKHHFFEKNTIFILHRNDSLYINSAGSGQVHKEGEIPKVG